jgi:glucokinase
MLKYLGLDVGGTKIAWGVFDEQEKLIESGQIPTPKSRNDFLEILDQLIETKQPSGIGVGIAGTISVDHKDLLVCQNIPSLSHLELKDYLQNKHQVSAAIDNDARCALIGEVWLGAARELSSVVMITLGTGVGGAVMQKEIILPHPPDLSQELGRLMVDKNDPFPAPTGAGTLEALLGGRNLEKRFGIKLAEIAQAVRKDDPEATDIWKRISYYFIKGVRAIHDTYSCRTIVVGGIGYQDLKYYLQDRPPCEVVPAALGEKAGIYGAARLAIDAYQDDHDETW